MSLSAPRPSHIPELDLARLQDQEQTVQNLSTSPEPPTPEVGLVFSPTSLRAMVGGPEIPKLHIPPQLFADPEESEIADTHQRTLEDHKRSSQSGCEHKTEGGGAHIAMTGQQNIISRRLNLSENDEGGSSPLSRQIELQFKELASGLNSSAEPPIAGLFEAEESGQQSQSEANECLLDQGTPKLATDCPVHEPLISFEPVTISSSPNDVSPFGSGLHGDTHSESFGAEAAADSTTASCRGCFGDFGLCVCPVNVSTEQAEEVLNTYRELRVEEGPPPQAVPTEGESSHQPNGGASLDQSEDEMSDSFDSCRSWEGNLIVEDQGEEQRLPFADHENHRLLEGVFGQPSHHSHPHGDDGPGKENEDQLMEGESQNSGEQPRGPIELNFPSPTKSGNAAAQGSSPAAPDLQNTVNRPRTGQQAGRSNVRIRMFLLLLVAIFLGSTGTCGYFFLGGWPQQSWQGQTRARLGMSMVHAAKAMERVWHTYAKTVKDMVSVVSPPSQSCGLGDEVKRPKAAASPGSAPWQDTTTAAEFANATSTAVAENECCRAPQKWYMKGLRAMPEDLPWDEPAEVPFH